MMQIRDIKKESSRDVMDVLLMEVLEDRDVYGRENEPGVVVILDTVTHVVYGLTILFYSKYPDVWKQSLVDLGFGAIVDQL